MVKCFVLLCLWACSIGNVAAQTAVLSTEEMIEQLKAPRTRSLRNLTIEATPPAAQPNPTSPGQLVTSPSSQTATPSPALQQATVVPSTAQAVPAPQIATAPQDAPSLSLNVQFDFNSARIRPESYAALDNLANALQSSALGQSRFLVEGHTDAKGAQEYNRKLSERRAQSVLDLLTSKGVPNSQLVAVGKGSKEPANLAYPKAAENRRVRIVNLD